MARGYDEDRPKRRGGRDRSRQDSGRGKNDQHGDSETHSRVAKGSNGLVKSIVNFFTGKNR